MGASAGAGLGSIDRRVALGVFEKRSKALQTKIAQVARQL